MRLWLAAALIALPSFSGAEVKNQNAFVHLTIADAESLDPDWAYDAASGAVINNIYEFLLAYQGSGVAEKDLIGRLSKEVPSRANGLISKDGLTYSFPIQRGIQFQGGAILTAEDVRYSLLRFMMTDRDGGPSSLLLQPILGVDSTRKDGKLIEGLYAQAAKAVTVDGDTVVIRLKKPFAPFLSILVNYGAVFSQNWCAAHGEWDGKAETLPKFNNPKRESSYMAEHANGTGPYALERLDNKTKEIYLLRWGSYWRDPAKIKRVVIRNINEFSTRKLMLSAGDADSIYGQLMYYPQLKELPGVTVTDGLRNLERSAILFFTLKLNAAGNSNIGSGKLDGEGVPPDFFSDKDVRKAFAYSVDYEGYVRDIQRGKGGQAVSFIPKGLLGYRSDLKKYRFDPEMAEQHFRRAWGGKAWEKGFKLSILFNAGSPQTQTVCQMIKKNVEALNRKFKIDVRGLQWSSYLEQSQARQIPVFMGAWQADYPDPHSFAFPLLHSKGYFPQKQGYSNPEVDQLIDDAAASLDPQERESLYGKLQEILYEDVPHVHIAEGTRYRTQRSWVKGYVFSPVFPDAPYSSYYYDLWKAE